jgi:DNA-binding NarL/FixJ family response regulator
MNANSNSLASGRLKASDQQNQRSDLIRPEERIPTSTAASRAYRILMADDHTLVAEACKKMLEPEFQVVGIVADGRALVRANALLRPDVVISDIAMKLLNGLDAGERIKAENPNVKLIFLTMFPDPELAAEAFERGATGYLLKTAAAHELVLAVRETLNGCLYISPQITRSSVPEFIHGHRKSEADKRILRPRQREVLQLLAEGRSMKEVASILNLTTRTVAFHKYRIMALLGLKTNAELVQYAIRTFLIPR